MGVLLGLEAPLNNAPVLHVNNRLGRVTRTSCRRPTRSARISLPSPQCMQSLVHLKVLRVVAEGRMLSTEIEGTSRHCRLLLPVFQQSKVRSRNCSMLSGVACNSLHTMQTLLTCFCLAGGVLAPSQNGGSMKVGKSADAAGGQLTPTPANLQNPDVSCESSIYKLLLSSLFGLIPSTVPMHDEHGTPTKV